MDTPIANLQPPYLRYDVPNELLFIQEKIEALREVSYALKPKPVKQLSESIKINKSSANLVKTVIEIPSDLPIFNPSSAKISQIGLEVVPNGKVGMGFNCRKTFTVSNNFNADTCYWEIHFKNLSTGLFDKLQFMGGSYTKVTHKHTITFDIDFQVYNQAAYVSSSVVIGGNNGLATFKVFCMGYNYAIPIFNSGVSSIPGPQCFSDEITLDFNGPHCIIINSISLSTNTLKGGKNDKEPNMTVYISAPAPPGGLKVLLSVSNNNLGNIMGDCYFIIPAGETSGSISWFLGTRRVYTTGKQFNIIAKLAYPDGSTSAEAYALITLNKQ
ncbi:hypothetical protein [Chryseobacterium limigenitum]|uniref:Uncharacterized protein n=1 Tax=Chryseobacterium limigenitum TaxID=1612149 RepID=A0A1K2IU71_9FLAO|nr:hypothetical protein [Chryseobacterium limigenitum]SFZ95985.1 hypothetical protein SAMN05216324_11494 [Chryseobacterium limigenitum]